MTNKKMFAFVAIFVSVLGFAFVGALKPVIIDYSIRQYTSQTIFNIKDEKIQLKTLHYDSPDQTSKMVNTDYLFTSLTSSLNIDEVSVYLQKLSESFPFQKIFVTGLQIKENNIDLPSNVLKVSSPLHFKEVIKNY